MPSFEETLARMKGLYTYGKEINESNETKNYALEHHAVAANGVTYGIIRECNKYYIKSAPKGKETIAEAYDYLGGFNNKKDFEYSSYANALKQFELKMASINEACDSKVNTETLDPFRANAVLVEGTDKMKNEIARCRQIMYNSSMLMNESSEIGAARKNDVVMFDGKNPEAETGKKGDEGMKAATAAPEYEGSKTNGVDKKVGPFDNGTAKCPDQLKESSDDDWASKGLPSTPGVGEGDACPKCGKANCVCGEDGLDADTDDDTDVDDIDDVDFSDTDFDTDDEDNTEDVDLGVDDDEDDLDADLDADDEDDLDADLDADDDEDTDIDAEEDDDDILAQIQNLQSQIDSLRAQMSDGGDEDADLDIDTDIDDDDEDGDDEDFEADDDVDFDADAEDDDLDAEDGDFDAEDNDFDAEDDDFDAEDDDFDAEDDEEENALMESKRARMNSIVESVVSQIINEDELHVFGKHPGYRKKPLELPSTGEDKNQWGRDWNDKSAHKEEPFGQKIGNGDPFNGLVDAITKDVMSKLVATKSDVTVEGKKKVK